MSLLDISNRYILSFVYCICYVCMYQHVLHATFTHAPRASQRPYSAPVCPCLCPDRGAAYKAKSGQLCGMLYNVSYVASGCGAGPIFFRKTDGGEVVPGAQEYPRKNFTNSQCPLVVSIFL